MKSSNYVILFLLSSLNHNKPIQQRVSTAIVCWLEKLNFSSIGVLSNWRGSWASPWFSILGESRGASHRDGVGLKFAHLLLQPEQ